MVDEGVSNRQMCETREEVEGRRGLGFIEKDEEKNR